MRHVATSLQERTASPHNTPSSFDRGNHLQKIPPFWLHDHLSLDTFYLCMEIPTSQIRPRLSDWKKGGPRNPNNPLCTDAAGGEVTANSLSRRNEKNGIYWKIRHPRIPNGHFRTVFLNFSLTELVNDVNYGVVTYDQIVAVFARLNEELVGLGITGVCIEDFKVCRGDLNLNLVFGESTSLIFEILDYCVLPYKSESRSHGDDASRTGGSTNNKSSCLAWYAKDLQLINHAHPKAQHAGRLLAEQLGENRIIRIEARALKALQCRNRLKLIRFGDVLANFRNISEILYENLESLRHELRTCLDAAVSVELKVPRHVTDETKKSLKRWQAKDKALELSLQSFTSALNDGGLNEVKRLLAEHSVGDSNSRDFIKRLQVACIKDLTVRNPETPLVIAELLERLEMRGLRQTQHGSDTLDARPDELIQHTGPTTPVAANTSTGSAVKRISSFKIPSTPIIPMEAIDDTPELTTPGGFTWLRHNCLWQPFYTPIMNSMAAQSLPIYLFNTLTIVKDRHSPLYLACPKFLRFPSSKPVSPPMSHSLQQRLRDTLYRVQSRQANRISLDRCYKEKRGFFRRMVKRIPRLRFSSFTAKLGDPPGAINSAEKAVMSITTHSSA